MRTHALTSGFIAALCAGALVALPAAPAAADAPVANLSGGLATPTAVAVDIDGSAFVTNSADTVNAVRVFDPGMVRPNAARTLTGVRGATGIAIHPTTREVFVASATDSQIAVFAPGATKASLGKTHAIAAPPIALDFDADGTLYALAGDGTVFVYPDGATGASRTMSVPVSAGLNYGQATGIGVDRATHDVLVALWGIPKCTQIICFPTPEMGIWVLPKGSTTGSHGLTGFSGGSAGLAVHAGNGDAYVAIVGTGVIPFSTATGQPRAQGAWLTGLDTPAGVTVSPKDGSIYVVDQGANKVFMYTGPASSITTIAPTAGPTTGGTAVTLTGINLGGISQVSFGGTPASSVVAKSVTTVTAIAPPHAVGTVDVAVSGWAVPSFKAAAFTYAAVAPGPAVDVQARGMNAAVDVTWTAPSFTGGVPVQGYVVTAAPGGATCSTTERDCRIGGLTNGQKYRFTVTTTNTAGLSSVSAPSAEVAPYVPVTQKVKAKSAKSKLPRKGRATVVNWVKRPKYATPTLVTATCTDGSARTTAELCTFTLYKTGKVKVRTKGFRGVLVTIGLASVPKAGAPVQYGPSTTWTRSWKVR